jgi:hypothetical protein
LSQTVENLALTAGDIHTRTITVLEVSDLLHQTCTTIEQAQHLSVDAINLLAQLR